MNTSSATASNVNVLQLVAKRWDVKPWELQEYVYFNARVERETEKAVLLVDATSKRRRSCWMPKSVLKGDKQGYLSPWANSKLVEAGFEEIDVISVGRHGVSR